ncbi:hypothetical protein MMC31_003013 [Peltigera leucophlebia]|nr:hypothetical protein [Peltigera leucophlebia]
MSATLRETSLSRTSVVSRNAGFADALQQHLLKLSPVEGASFRDSYQSLTPESILLKVKAYDQAHNRGSASRKCAEKVDKSLRILNQFLASIAIAIQSNPDISSLIVGGLKFILDLAVKYVTFFKKLTDMIDELFGYLATLREFDCGSGSSDLVRKTVSDVYGDLLDFCRQVRLLFLDKQGQSRRYISVILFLRVQWEPFEAQFGKVSSSFRYHLGVLDHSVQALQYNAIQDGNRATEIERSAGAGKSVLASRVIEHIQEQHALNDEIGIVYAYLQYDSPETQEPSNLLRAFIKQLCFRKELDPLLLDFFNEYSRDARVPLFEKLQSQFIHLASSFTGFFVVIDALDEAPQKKRKNILKMIRNLASELPYARIFATSRKEQDITNTFSQLKAPTVEIEAKNSAEDINIYVRGKVESLISEEELVLEDSSLKRTIIQELISKADGMFLWVDLQLDSLCQQESDPDILKELNRLPQGLHQTYARALLQIKKKPETIQQLARKCLMWVFYAQRPLSMTDLRIAVAIEWPPSKTVTPTYSAEAILASCSNLLMEIDDFVRPIHYSVREFFTSPSQREIDNIYAYLILGVDPSEVRFASPPQIECDRIRKNICFETDQCESEIAIACVSYLTSEDVLADLSEGPFKYQLILSDRIQGKQLLRYCSTNFDKHAQNVQEPKINILNALDYFLSIDTKALTTIMQIRSVNVDHYFRTLESYLWKVDAMAMIYSTALFTLPHLRESKWMKKEAYKSLLHYAATGGLLDAIEHLIISGVSVNAKDENGVMALYYASENGHYDICQLFLQNSADINTEGGYYGSALQAASAKGHENVVQFLLDKGADINLIGGEYGCALQAASAEGHENIVQLLLNKGADVNLTGGKYGCALQAASAKGHENLVQLLYAKGADSHRD